MTSSPATMAAASRIMSHSKGSLQHLLRRHLLLLHPTAGADSTSAAAVQLINKTPGSLLPLLSGSIEHRSTGSAPIQSRFGSAAERFVDQCRIEVRGDPIKIEDEDEDEDGDDDSEEGDFDEDDLDDYATNGYPSGNDSDEDDESDEDI